MSDKGLVERVEKCEKKIELLTKILDAQKEMLDIDHRCLEKLFKDGRTLAEFAEMLEKQSVLSLKGVRILMESIEDKFTLEKEN